MIASRFHWAGYVLGFALAGFFDGILLHQILQWHHLLLGVEDEAYKDIRTQILADGLFHALMYVVALVGLALLWRSRREFSVVGAGRLIIADALLGFAAWQFVDVILAHWIMAIHRVRMVDTSSPLMWDLIWIALFGIVPLVLGLALRRDRLRGGLGPAIPSLLAVAVVGAGALSAVPRDASQVVVYFGSGGAAQAYRAAAAVDARTVWTDQSGQLWVFALGAPADAWRLYRHGALFVGGAAFPAGCLAWSRTT